MSDYFCYEQPLSKPVRLFMRFEQLMERFNAHVEGPARWDTQAAFHALLDIYQLTAHADLKADVLREIDRLALSFKRAATASTDTEADQLTEISAQIQRKTEEVNNIKGQLGAHLKNHLFFNTVRQRMAMPGGMNPFDLPILHHWLGQPPQQRTETLQEWIQPYARTNRIITSLLDKIRGHHKSEQYTANHGYFEKPLKQGESYQMLRICLPRNSTCYPEVSSGMQRFSVRFFEPENLSTRPKQTRKDIEFETIYCGL